MTTQTTPRPSKAKTARKTAAATFGRDDCLRRQTICTELAKIVTTNSDDEIGEFDWGEIDWTDLEIIEDKLPCWIEDAELGLALLRDAMERWGKSSAQISQMLISSDGGTRIWFHSLLMACACACERYNIDPTPLTRLCVLAPADAGMMEAAEAVLWRLKAKLASGNGNGATPTSNAPAPGGGKADDGKMKATGAAETSPTGNTPAPKPAAKGMTWQTARDKAEQFIADPDHSWPGFNRLAKMLVCLPSTLSKAVQRSPKLKAAQAQYKADHKAARPQNLSAMVLDSTAQTTEPDPRAQTTESDALKDLIAEQEADDANDASRANRAHRRSRV